MKVGQVHHIFMQRDLHIFDTDGVNRGLVIKHRLTS